MKVTQLANKLGVSADTVRFYTRIGLLNPSKSPNNGYKTFNHKDMVRMQFILSARNLGFSVEDIKVIFSKTDLGDSACQLVRELIKVKLLETEQQFNEMVKLRSKLSKAIQDWSQMPDNIPTGNMICHLIENTNQEDIVSEELDVPHCVNETSTEVK
ncbi:MerR family transcriptional regulator [Shewanella sp. SR43-4]|mgnify:FL=1|jgi:DNA-binding transcriptional MerR regulator|uniref:MerR family transcriptional regulator n=1 Tax=Shewanella xiamenensis TaxID=332186 RepID=A0AAE4TI22_9GAMM|nr:MULTISPECIES: MerR family transcriptional regulator [Shewanella]MBB1381223.1 MerR family transcriptional regulator [Shewanella sp. SR41-2]MBB1270998.1 MerR family transcriptional regulator [Shewanella sp. SR44-3]MBB1318626.1 MerR family transcriptional regulator [Shewanella sp. SR43-4]MCL1091991.1 MerR family transcriptional regulator [Shewanella profunda]MCS6116992.1 MerR family transcriptional regulator [Shewanella baltica]|tara:strand:+ start:559 stop:1029 length:471 start_codon:yes stop_codon:yes gene_type:complete